jgi:hypothetical protein
VLQPNIALTLNLPRRGQNGRLAFAGTAGQTLALQIAGQSTVPSSRTVYYTVYKPDGSMLNSFSATSSGTLNMPSLPNTGTYVVFVDPVNGESISSQVLIGSQN